MQKTRVSEKAIKGSIVQFRRRKKNPYCSPSTVKVQKIVKIAQWNRKLEWGWKGSLNWRWMFPLWNMSSQRIFSFLQFKYNSEWRMKNPWAHLEKSKKSKRKRPVKFQTSSLRQLLGARGLACTVKGKPERMWKETWTMNNADTKGL